MHPLAHLPVLLTLLGTDPAPATAAAANTAEAIATTGSRRIAFAAREWLDVGLDVSGVTVDRVKLREPGKMKGLFIKHDEANRGTLVVTNRTDRKVQPAIAVAVLDGEGRLLAAANTGARTRTVQPGETAEMGIHFGGVFRHIEKGSYILVSLEF
jgi:hypothetical protein